MEALKHRYFVSPLSHSVFPGPLLVIVKFPPAGREGGRPSALTVLMSVAIALLICMLISVTRYVKIIENWYK